MRQKFWIDYNKEVQKKLYFFKKTLDKSNIWNYNFVKFEYHKNDYDEDGRIDDPGESCRLVRGNGETFQ